MDLVVKPMAEAENLTWRDKIGNIIADIGDWGKDVITDVGNNLSNEWKNFTEWVDNSWVGDAWDWVKDNKTIQTIAAAIIATAVIVGGIALLVANFSCLGIGARHYLGNSCHYRWFCPCRRLFISMDRW